MKAPYSLNRCMAGAGLLLLLATGYIAVRANVTRFETKTRTNTTAIDIVHGLPGFDFQGETPVLKVVSGDKQTKTAGFLPQPIVVAVFHADGVTPWPGAPV